MSTNFNTLLFNEVQKHENNYMKMPTLTRKDVELFENMYDYVSEFNTDISDYTISRNEEEEFVLEEEQFLQNPELFTFDRIEVDGVEYIGVNWGEKDISYIKESGLDQILYTIYQKGENGEYNNYRSWIFQTDEEAQAEVGKLNKEVN